MRIHHLRKHPRRRGVIAPPRCRPPRDIEDSVEERPEAIGPGRDGETQRG